MAHFQQSRRLTGTADAARRSAVQECLVLQYHRVAQLAHDPLRLGVQPHHFESQMEYLAMNCNVISLGELHEHLETGTPFRDHTVAVTFDGGYADLLYTAKAVLESFEIPATVFVPSAPLIERGLFWWDVLEDVLIAGHPPEQLVLDIEASPRCWSLATQRDRFRAFHELYLIFSHESPSVQKDLVRDMAHLLDGPGEDRDNHATLGARDLRVLEEGGLITIGGYPHSGTNVSLLPEEEQGAEIGRNQRILEEILRHRISYFAYPMGEDETGTAVTARILAGLGFTLAFGASSDTVGMNDSRCPYGLPRVRIHDWNPFTFHRYVEAFLD